MTIRLTRPEDCPALLAVYAQARAFMRSRGNLHQWSEDYPGAESLADDIAAGASYVVEHRGRPVATFCFKAGPDPTYAAIDGAWLYDGPYSVLHRVASDGSVAGMMRLILDFCFERVDTIRIDTHEDNAAMRNCLERYGFGFCGIIRLANGDPRLAYEMRKI